ncbi:MAG: 3-isopropylmalate dehydratase large subunit [Betaproteobacteria bacterium]
MQPSQSPQTLFERIWARHAVVERDDGQTLLYIDRHLVQDASAPAFEMLRQSGRAPRVPERAFASPDHYVPTANRDLSTMQDPEKRAMAHALHDDAKDAGIRFFGIDDPRQGIVHVIGPEQGITQPGMLLVCGDSHTSTHGALGALAFGIGASEVAHVLATQALWQRKPRTLRIRVEGTLNRWVSAKDVILAIIARIGAAGAVGHVIEYAGSAIRALSIEGRLTLCNMSIEAGGRAGMVSPDDATFEYLAGRPFAPTGANWDAALARWRALATHPDAQFDRDVELDAAAIEPMVTWGNSPEQALSVGGRVPDPASVSDQARRDALTRTLDYMGLTPGQPIAGLPVQRVFIGSCTNGRIEDFRAAAAVVHGRRVAPGVEAWAVPGSGLVKAQAEAEGLDRVFEEAGIQWRHAGCSMCVGMNGDLVAPGDRCASTSNRNFVGRQGPGSRTHLMSPAMAAAAAVTGAITDVRQLVAGH